MWRAALVLAVLAGALGQVKLAYHPTPQNLRLRVARRLWDVPPPVPVLVRVLKTSVLTSLLEASRARS